VLSIGEFSKICGVTTRTLRHYDSIGLLKPVHIHPDTGYRFYDVSQLRRLLLITRLKDYCFSLDEIVFLLASPDKKYLLEKITVKKKELRAKIDYYKTLEHRLTLDILHLERGVDIMSFLDEIQVTLVEVQPQPILHSRQRMSIEDYGTYIGKLFEQANLQTLPISGPPMSIYHDKEFDPADNDTEVALPVQGQNAHTRILSGGLCATATCQGPYSNLPHVYAKLTEWIGENNYVMAAPPYEQYLKGPMEAPAADTFVTQIYFPVQKVGQPE
jgi:DNA-binding transcriptional MerR regulator